MPLISPREKRQEGKRWVRREEKEGMSWPGEQKRETNKQNGVRRKKTTPPRTKQKSPVLKTENSPPFFSRAGVNIVHCPPFVRVYISCYNTWELTVRRVSSRAFHAPMLPVSIFPPELSCAMLIMLNRLFRDS